MSKLPIAGSKAVPFTLKDANGISHGFGETRSPVTLIFFFKYDCATCDLTAPIIKTVHQALSSNGLTVIGVSQDDAELTATFSRRHDLTFPRTIDAELLVSDTYGFDAVPSLVLSDSDDTILASIEGFSKHELFAMIKLAAERCNSAVPMVESPGAPLPEMRPGCGSRVHEPEIAKRLEAKRHPSTLTARQVRIPVDIDPFEFFDEQGLTDGLPVVPPTEERVKRMLQGTSRSASEVIANVPPNLAPATVEKIAINAVMAGCKPAYLPVVIAAVEACCTDAFNLHGVLATTYFVSPLVIVNGPIRHTIGLNCGRNVFGQGSRANATIGRALQLVVRNVGGGRPGEVDMSTLGQPGKFTACVGENEELSCWEPLHVERGFKPEESTVTVFAAEAPRAIRDQLSRNSPSLAASIGLSLEATAHIKLHGMDQVLLVVSPEHARTFERDGYTKNNLRKRIQEVTSRPLREVLPSDECQKGTALRVLPKAWLDSNGNPTSEALDQPFPKFSRSEDILIMVAGGTAGKFSAAVGGWATGGLGSKAVTRRVLE